MKTAKATVKATIMPNYNCVAKRSNEGNYRVNCLRTRCLEAEEAISCSSNRLLHKRNIQGFIPENWKSLCHTQSITISASVLQFLRS